MSDSTMQSTDWVLDQLEQLARSGDPDNLFYNKLTQALVPILQANSVLLAIELESKPMAVCSAGEPLDPKLLEVSLPQVFPKIASSKQPVGESSGGDVAHRWIFARFPKNHSALPMALVAYFSQPLDQRQRTGTKNLMDAFVEVCEVREVYVENSRTVGLWKQAIARGQDFTHAQSHSQLHRGVVEALRDALKADRVSLYLQAAAQTSMLACSGVASIDSTSSAVRDLQSAVDELISANEPKLWNANPNVSEEPAYRLFLPWPSGSNPSVHGLLVEWSDPQAMIDRVQKASSLLPIFNQAWQSQNRWLYLPSSVQQQAQGKTASISQRGHFSRWWLALAGLLAVIAIGMVRIPFYIQSQAYLEPYEQRFIHASAESFIQELLVREGESVGVDQPLVQLRSPALELQMEESEGQIRALEEKKNGLRIAVNQLSSNASDLANQTRLSAELKLIEVQEKQATEKRAFFKQQQAELLVKSPIEGVVVGGDLKRELSDRPLQRGDVLFRVADLQGAWQLRLFVSDRDGGYVQKALDSGPVVIDWGLENSTRRGLKARLSSMTNQVDQRPDYGPSRTAIARLDSDQLDQPVIGAVAYARIPCGTQPLWFIWSRPLVEFLQKRFWLTSTPQSNLSNHQG